MFFVSLILNGIVLGSILVLVSLGLTLMYGVGRVVNFAHGALYSIGAMVGAVVVHAGYPFWACLIAAPLVVGFVGFVIDLVLLSRIRDRPMVDSLLLTFGLALLITGVLYDAGGRTVQVVAVPAALDGVVGLFGATLPAYRIFISCIALLLAGILLIALKATAWGIRVRAANDDAEMAATIGIDRETLMHSVVACGAALAAFAGAAAAPIFTAFATVGDKMLILAFLTVIMGGLGSFRGALVAAYVVGLIVVVGEGYVGGQAALMLLFVLVMVFLVRWPRGVFGEGRLE